ncbi:bifunctional phosphoglucose/phosphomannose isomerase [Chloroflexota bacterium]
MVYLDDLKTYKKHDTINMLHQLHGLPEQCRSAWQKAVKVKLPNDYRNIDKVVILGMGGSAIGGDLVRSLASCESNLIVFVSRDYELPSFVDEKTLIIASSYSGNTEETLSAFNQALKIKCKKLAITTGGKLKEIAETARVPVFTIDHVSSPRAALGYSFMPIVAFLRNLGLLKGIAVDVPSMIRTLQKTLEELKETVPADTNFAKQLALKLHGRITVIYGAEILSDVARRWKTQINENSKAWAFYDILPELNHNTVVGYTFPVELASKLFVVFLRCPLLHHRTLIRYQITSELLAQNSISHQVLNSQGDDVLSQMMSLVFLGDWVSYYLAILYRTDPTPVKLIDHLKKRLSEVQ